jgi:histone acetyltransferase (RNA polymerase elongator complex component)
MKTKKIHESASLTPKSQSQQLSQSNQMTERHNLAPYALSLTPVRYFRHPATSSGKSNDRMPQSCACPSYPAASYRPFILPIFLPHAGCPHQCVFCNQVSITGTMQKAVNADQIRSQIHQFLGYKNDRRKPVQISFFGGNFLGLKTDEIKLLLDLASEFVRQGQVDSIRFSTRPDTVDLRRLDIIADYPVATVELGVQSMDDHVLALAERGHSAEDTVRAVELLKNRNFNIGLQMMVGLPGDTEALSLITAEKIAELRPDFVRIYPTIVVKNSQLARWYQNGTYAPLSLEEAVNRVTKLYLFFNRNNIAIIRMGLQASGDLEDGSTVLAGPYHPAFGHLVYSEVFLNKVLKEIESATLITDSISIGVNPNSISKLRGIQNRNIKILKEKFGFESIEVKADYSLNEDQLNVSRHL